MFHEDGWSTWCFEMFFGLNNIFSAFFMRALSSTGVGMDHESCNQLKKTFIDSADNSTHELEFKQKKGAFKSAPPDPDGLMYNR